MYTAWVKPTTKHLPKHGRGGCGFCIFGTAGYAALKLYDEEMACR
jgi:hypothetical protein